MITELFRAQYLRIINKEVESNGKMKTFEIAERAPWVRLLLVDFSNRILLSKERRHEFSERDYRLPGWKLFDDVGDYVDFLEWWWSIWDKAYDTVIKECKEETGYGLISAELVKVDYVGSTMSRDLYYYVSKDFWVWSWQELEYFEDISCEWYEWKQVLEFLKQNKILESRTKAFLYDYILNNYDLSNK